MDFSDSKDGDEATRKNNPLYRRIGNIHGVERAMANELLEELDAPEDEDDGDEDVDEDDDDHEWRAPNDPEGQCSDEERPCVELTWGEADVLWGHIEISREG